MSYGYGIVMRNDIEGYTDVGLIPSGKLKADVHAKTNALAAGMVAGAVKTVLNENDTGKLYFTDVNPNQNTFGLEITPDNMGQLKNWAITDKRTIYFFNVPA